MILVDTSVWVDHFRVWEPRLVTALEEANVLVHPFVIGELALGSLKDRDAIIDALQALPKASVAREEEVLRLITTRRLFGSGIGYVDAHLLAAALLTPGSRLWSRDKRLAAAAGHIGIAWGLPQ